MWRKICKFESDHNILGIRIFLLQTKNNFWDQNCQKQKKGNGDFYLQNATLEERLWIQGNHTDLITKCGTNPRVGPTLERKML